MRLSGKLSLCGIAIAFLLSRATVALADPEVDELRLRVGQLETEIKSLNGRLAKLEGETLAKRPRALKITVVSGDWGAASPADISAVCQSAAAELARYFPERDWDPISIRCDARQGPMVIYGKGPDGERRVLLNVRETYWSQYSYQFAHELCHILCNYRDGNKANLWFEESLCETASLFVLRRMAETWKTKPPFANWKSYAEKLHDYAEKRLADTEKLDGLTLAQWYLRNEPELRKVGTDRAKNQIAATTLLALFERNPDAWKAVAFLNKSDPQKELSFAECLRDWHERVPQDSKKFVGEVMKEFGIAEK